MDMKMAAVAGGIFLIVVGLGMVIAYSRPNKPRARALEGFLFIELGLTFIATHGFPKGPLQQGFAIVFGLGAFMTLIYMVRLDRAEDRKSLQE